jgi:DNA-binding IclR family transcriptional regulator
LQEVRTVLERLARLSRETVQLGILDGSSVVYVDEIKGPERVAVVSSIGGTMAAHETGLGLALLAASPETTISRYLAGITDAALRARLHEELARTQARAYGIALEPGPIGIRSLGVAIRSAQGTPVFGLGLIGPAPRFTQERAEAFAPHMVATARSLSMAFGWQEGTVQGDHQ